jgi:hypothetical protein
VRSRAFCYNAEIKGKIMNAAAEYVKNQLEAKRAELRRIEDMMLRVQGAIAALEATLDQVMGSGKRGRKSIASPIPGLSDIINGLKRPKLHDLAYSVLKEAGKPLTGDQIIPLMAARGCTSTKQSILGAIYRAAKSGDRFTVGRGVFGLLEWGTDLV